MGDADITLRHLTRRHAEALARPYVRAGSVEVVRWADTQVTATERRLDRTLLLRHEGEMRALEIELQYRYEGDLPERVHDYRSLSRMAFRAEFPGEAPPPMETVVILLTGRRRRWRQAMSLRTGWAGRPFSGARFRVDAVYQRSVADLFARGSPFWLAFAPLARDANVEAMRAVVGAIRAETPEGEDRWELFAALLVMADVDPWGHNLREEIEVMIEHEPTDLIQVSKTLRNAYDLGQRDGIEKGIEKGVEKGVEKMLRHLLVQRLHRALTAREQAALTRRAAIEPEQIQDRALALEGEALAAWLLASDATRDPAAAGPSSGRTGDKGKRAAGARRPR